MENTNIDALMFLSKYCEDNKIFIEEELKKEIAKIMFYYTKESSNSDITHNRLSDSDIGQANNESKMILNEIEHIKASIHRLGQSQDVITRLTS